jgi:hypothetical protein
MKFTEKHPHFEPVIANSGIGPGSIEAIQTLILNTYDELAVPLPDSAAWKHNKPAHARKARKEVAMFADLLGLSPLAQQYVAIACSAHDLGRMVQANKRAGTQPEGLYSSVFDDALREVPYDDDDQRHGYESNLLLKPILGEFANTTAGQWLLDAVLYHSLKENPTLEMCGGSVESLGLSGIVRDIDRVLGFHDAVDYTSNPERKAKERMQNWGIRVTGDPSKGIAPDEAWGTELGCIDPAHFLLDTPFEKPINRLQCRSYEAYMLQFLKWVPQITSEPMMQVVLHEGGPQVVAAYLLKQLEQAPEQREHLLRELESYLGGALLRTAQAA